MDMMIAWRYGRLDYYIKQLMTKQISNDEFWNLCEPLRNEIGYLEWLRDGKI